MIKMTVGKTYCGLTDDPIQRKQQHGNPRDWSTISLPNEDSARAWERKMLNMGYEGGTGGGGWRYGYTYTITAYTTE